MKKDKNNLSNKLEPSINALRSYLERDSDIELAWSFFTRFGERFGEKFGENTQTATEHTIMTAREVAQQLDISQRAVEKQIDKLKRAGKLCLVWPDKGGYWEVLEI